MTACRTATAKEISEIRAAAREPDYYAMLGLKFSLWSDNSRTSELFRHIYRNFLISGAESVNYDFCFLSRNNGQEPILLANNRLYALKPSSSLDREVHNLVFDTLTEGMADYFIFHGAAVCRNNQGIIIMGPAGAGKTTLALKLVQEGYEFLSDEIAPVHRQSLELHPFPLSLGLRPGTLGLFPGLAVYPLQYNLNVIREEKWLLDANHLKPRTTPCRLKAIYFLNSDISSPRGGEDRVRGKEDYLIDVILYQEEPEFAAALCALPGVGLVNLQQLDGYAVYRFQVERRAYSLTNFLRACQPFKESIFYREEVSRYEPDFSRKKNLVPLDKSRAALEMLKHLRNRTGRSLLRSDFPRPAQLLLEMGRVIEGVECWWIEYSG